MVQKIVTYKTDDGFEFSDEDAAISHEINLKNEINDKVKNWLNSVDGKKLVKEYGDTVILAQVYAYHVDDYKPHSYATGTVTQIAAYAAERIPEWNSYKTMFAPIRPIKTFNATSIDVSNYKA